MIKLELEQNEVEMLISALGKFPLEQVLSLWQKIQIQAAPQLAAAASTGPVEGANTSE